MTTENEASTNKVKFRPRARLLYIVGADLIKDEMAGIVELVKNAYDADATSVTITFEKLDDPAQASLTVEDNGHGMSWATIEHGWLSPASAEKGSRKTSPNGRPMQGRKGVGRFSAMRLGDHLSLRSIPGKREPRLKTKELGKGYQMSISWSGMEHAEEYLDELEFEVAVLGNVSQKDHGVRLTISGLADQWHFERIGRLVRELRLLLSPLPLMEEQDEFRIYLDLAHSNLEKEYIYRLPREIVPYAVPDVADYVVTAQIDKCGAYQLSYQRRLLAKEDPEDATLQLQGDDIRHRFRQVDREKLLLHEAKSQAELPCGPLDIRLHIWDRDIELLMSKATKLASDVENMGIRSIRRLLDEVSGISIYRDNFRVRPYGPEDRDWLGLGQRRVQLPRSRIGPNQLFGIVDISSVGNAALDDKASREGLKENKAYHFLQACVLAVLLWVEPVRYRFREKHELGRPEPASTMALVEERQEAFDELRERIPGAMKDENAGKELLRLVRRAEQVSEKEQERFSEQTRVLHDNHALGLLARFVLHSGRNVAGTLSSCLRNIDRESERGKRQGGDKMLLEGKSLYIFGTNLQSAQKSVHRLDTMLDQLDPLTRPRPRRRSTIPVEVTISKVTSVLEADIQSAKIHFFLSKGKHAVMAWEADLFSALYYLLHNSIYWVQEQNSPGDRKIEIQVDRVDAEAEKPKVAITVSDNGPGVTSAAALRVFDLGYTEKPGGYGVGLFLAREAVERSGGSIELLNPDSPGAQFRIMLEEGS